MLDLFKKYLKYLLIDYPQGNTCLLQIGICHLPLQGLNHVLLIFKTPWKEFRVESRNEALCALGKTGRTGLQIVRHFWSWFYEPKILIFFSSYLEKHQNPSWWHRCLLTKQEPSAKKKKKNRCLIVYVPSSPKSLVYQASPTSWASQVAQTVKNLPSMRARLGFDP